VPRYADLTSKDFIQYATTVPAREEWANLHDYIDDVRTLVRGNDRVQIPESHTKLLRGENHEGSLRLALRIRQLAAWLSSADIRFSVPSGGDDETARIATATQERFMRAGEKKLGLGTTLNRWRQQHYRDIAECGVGVIQMNPRKDYYLYARENPGQMAEGALLADITYQRRVDPLTFSAIPTDDGDIGVGVTLATRSLGEIALKTSIEAARRTIGFFDFGTDLDPSDPTSWDPGLTVEVAEVWGSTNGALVLTGGNGRAATKSWGPSTHGKILATWPNLYGRPPFYLVAPSTQPFVSPLDEMIQLTNARNYLATMSDLQMSGAIFRHWQLVDTSTGEDMTDRLPIDAAPEHVRYDLSKPPPNMGQGTRWELAPFEFQDISQRYAEVVLQHETAGNSVGRLMGSSVNQNTPVGTADIIADQAKLEFSEYTEGIEAAVAQRWTDWMAWFREHHSDPVRVTDRRRDTGNFEGFVTVKRELRGEDVISEDIVVTMDTRSRVQKVADFRFAVEKISNGMSDYDREVEDGNIPGVDDSESEKAAIFVAEAERIEAQVELMRLQRVAMQVAGLAEPPPGAGPRFLEGTRTDPRGTGTGSGPDNVSDTALSESSPEIMGQRAS
jgi:hypothetical protein